MKVFGHNHVMSRANVLVCSSLFKLRVVHVEHPHLGAKLHQVMIDWRSGGERRQVCRAKDSC